MGDHTRRYDLARMALEARQLVADITTLKKIVRQSKYLPTWQEYRQLHDFKSAVTVLCILRAHHRGRTHLPSQLERTMKTIEQHEAKYLLESREAAA